MMMMTSAFVYTPQGVWVRLLKRGAVPQNSDPWTEPLVALAKDSGLGQVNGRHAIRSYTHTLPILIDRWGQKRESIWYPYADKTVKTLDSTIKVLFGNHLVRRFMR